MPLLNLSPDELLSTTRSVRKRLDFSRAVESEVIQECLELAVQAPTGGNSQNWHFVLVTDAQQRQALGDIYRGGLPVFDQAGMYGSILPAVWSFMLAARARGLGTCWTTFHLYFEQEAAEVLGIPYEQVTQVALTPVAYTLGTDFMPAPRIQMESIVHCNKL